MNQIQHKFDTFPKEIISRITLIGYGLEIDHDRMTNAISRYNQEAFKLLSHNGKTTASKVLKSYYACIKAKQLGIDIVYNQKLIWKSTNKEGMPKVLSKILKDFDSTNDNHSRWLLSLFSLYETWKVDKCVADLSTLTKVQECDWSLHRKKDFVKFCVSQRNSWKRKTPSMKEVKHFVSLKGGPNGQATVNSHHCAKKLLSDNRTLKLALNLLSSQHESPNKVQTVAHLKDVSGLSQRSVDSMLMYKTIGIPDKGPKVRTITMGNYYLQYILKPMHDCIMSTLKATPEDGTYRQDHAAQTVKSWTEQGKQPWCFDLSAATDRFPIKIQFLTLLSLNFKGSRQWYGLLNKVNSYAPQLDTNFKFSVGQPMGIYTSWPVFALTHHLLVRYAFNIAGTDFRYNYYIIGDDISILCPRAAVKYRELILALGISISQAKSITPSNMFVKDRCSAELAKRYFRNGKEISPVRPFEIDSLKGKGWPLILETIPNLIKRWGLKDINVLMSPSQYCANHSYLSMCDQTHRKKLALVSLCPFGGFPQLVTSPPDWWPSKSNHLLLRAVLSYGYDKLTDCTSRIFEIHKKLLDGHTIHKVTQTDSNISILQHPLVLSLKLLDADVQGLWRKLAVDNLVFDDIFSLNLNLELLESLVVNPKPLNDFKSFRLKRSTAQATAILDIWAVIINEFGYQPKDDNYLSPKSIGNVYLDDGHGYY